MNGGARAQSQPSPLDDLVVVPSGGPHELERGTPVVREHLRVILRSAEAVDPFGHGAMPLSAVGAGDLSVRDVADERVRERELALAFE